MGKKKSFPRIELSIPTPAISRTSNDSPHVVESLPPAVTIVRFPAEGNATTRRTFDFGKWYGGGADQVVFVCQRQIERLLATGDSDLSVASIQGYCTNSLARFFDYCVLIAGAAGRELDLDDLSRDLVRGFVAHLRTSHIKVTTQRLAYTGVKSIIHLLARNAIIEVISGKDGTFPENPYPQNRRHQQGATPLTKAERKKFAAALKTALMPLYDDDVKLTSNLLSYVILAIALRTGRNTTPLIELSTNCLHPHPKPGMKILICFKRRGASTQTVPVRFFERVEMTTGVLPDVVRLIERVITLTSPFREKAPSHLHDRLLIFQTNMKEVAPVTDSMIFEAIGRLIANANLAGPDDTPLHVTVSRLRKTFANRIFEILGGDLGATARALGDTTIVTDRHYLTPSTDAERNWRFMGEVLTKELKAGSLHTVRTPIAQCSDPTSGQFAPKNGLQCTNFVSCLRCRNWVVTGNADDLHRLFSFYWLIVAERNRVPRRKWERHYSHLIRIIDRDVIEHGLSSGKLDPHVVASARERARTSPHPFWSSPEILEAIE